MAGTSTPTTDEAKKLLGVFPGIAVRTNPFLAPGYMAAADRHGTVFAIYNPISRSWSAPLDAKTFKRLEVSSEHFLKKLLDGLPEKATA